MTASIGVAALIASPVKLSTTRTQREAVTRMRVDYGASFFFVFYSRLWFTIFVVPCATDKR